MRETGPSQTAARVAAHRAVHQLVDEPRVFDDPLALAILEPEVAARLRRDARTDDDPSSRGMRAFVAVRSRYAEDKLAQAVARGVVQYVVLGAGLDTFAYRNPYAMLRVYEIDHPATQVHKRALLRKSGIAEPASLRFAPVDFECETVVEGLARAGFDETTPAFFSWLGVAPYLEPTTTLETLRTLAALHPANGVVFDYALRRRLLSAAEQRDAAVLAARVAAAGEPFRGSFAPDALATELRAMGFTTIEDMGKETLNDRYFRHRTDGLCVPWDAAHLMSAVRWDV